MLRQLGICALTAVCAFALGTVFVADAQGTNGEIEVTLFTESVGITINNGNLNFGGPHGTGTEIRAHPQRLTQEGNRDLAAPTITNSGNVPLTSIEVTYGGPPGEQAICVGGGTWIAHATTAGADQFRMRAWAATDPTFTQFNNNSKNIHPSNGTGNILRSLDSPLAANASVPLFLQLFIPTADTVGAAGCTIALVVTASAS